MEKLLHLEVKNIIRETHDTVSFILTEKNGLKVDFLAGQFLTLLFNIDGEEIRRGYSISSSPYDLPTIRITIKKVKNGFASHKLLDEIKKGDILYSLPPLGNFVYSTNGNGKKIFLFGAGSGITPLYSILKTALLEKEKPQVYLYYSNKTEKDIIFKEELEELQLRFPNNFILKHTLTQPSDDWKGDTGRITKEKAIEYLSKFNFDILEKAEYYLCGPEGMMKNVLDALVELKITKKKIHRENFTISILNEADQTEEVERDITIIFKDKAHKIKIKPDETILQKALSLGLELPNSCQIGECGTCRAKLLSGKLKLIEQTALSEDEIKLGYCLTCVGHPASDDVVILYEDSF
ncbi:2Fe-2S iron-sulfur cluster-binding protein [Melioribacteraceae bacterium 4301-Me]|uniref:2Fe-2S iron-sulfur cluster-binding protein n=1 Tax=Pyranulibacter aquaticus TaxID=3163344 RepID=UPI003598B516